MHELETFHVQHVFLSIHSERGALLCYESPWGTEEALALETILQKGSAGPRSRFDGVIVFCGSEYELSYRRNAVLESFTIREHSRLARPLGMTESGPHVNELCIYRHTGSMKWRAQRPGEELELPALETVAA